eukprot:11633487-Alexandrium_andersonii.AAC.1
MQTCNGSPMNPSWASPRTASQGSSWCRWSWRRLATRGGAGGSCSRWPVRPSVWMGPAWHLPGSS